MGDLTAGLKSKLQKILEHLKGELATIRSGTASSSLVENMPIEAYGGTMKLSEAAAISLPEPTLIVIQPWDATIIPAIEKAILKSSLNVSPVVAENIIRLPLPPLTQERREEFVKLARETAEQTKIVMRQVRHEALTEVKMSREDGQISEDDEHRLRKSIQTEVEKASGEIEHILKKKEQDLLKV